MPYGTVYTPIAPKFFMGYSPLESMLSVASTPVTWHLLKQITIFFCWILYALGKAFVSTGNQGSMEEQYGLTDFFGDCIMPQVLSHKMLM